MAGLTPKQERFTLHYFEHGDASKAYRHAYSTERMKPASVHRLAHQLLKNIKIASRLEELKASQQERTQIDADYVLKRAVGILNADLSELYEADGALKPISEWPKELMPIVAGIEVTELKSGDETISRQVTKVRLSERTKMLDLIAKHKAVDAFVRPNRGTADEPIHQNIDVSAPEIAKAVNKITGQL